MGRGSFWGHSSAQCPSGLQSRDKVLLRAVPDFLCRHQHLVELPGVQGSWRVAQMSRMAWRPGVGYWTHLPSCCLSSVHSSRLFQPQGNSSCADGLVLERPRLEGEAGAERRQPGDPWLRAPWDSAAAIPWGVGPESHQTPNQEGQVESRLLIVPCALRKEAVGRLGDGGSRRQPGSATLALNQSQGCSVAVGIALPGWPRVPPPARNHVVLD